MPYACDTRRLLLVLAVLALLTAVSGLAWAADMELYAGFDNTTKAGVWTPIGVKLTNAGDRTVEGILQVKQDVPNRRTMPVCTAKVSLPGNSTKLCYVYTRRQEYGGVVTVSLMHGTRTVATRNVSPATTYQHDKLIVSLGDRASKLSFLSGERIPQQGAQGVTPPPPGGSPSGQTDATIQAASISPLMLPDRPAAYQAVDVMVIGDLGAMSVDPKALKAIAMWVASGGTLVVSTGPNYRSFQGDFFNELLPVTVTGATSVPTLGVLDQSGKAPFPGGPVAVATSVPKPGICRGTISVGGTPIYAVRGYGAGLVVFLAFDYKASPFRDWNGQTEFWKSIIIPGGPGVMVQENTDWLQQGSYYPGYRRSTPGIGASLNGVVEQNQSIKTPSFNVIALYLLAYLIFLVPLNYMYLKRKRRMELAWISTPAIVLLFTFGAYAIGYTMKGGKLEMGVATVIEGSANCRYARTISEASLFSPSRRSYNIEINDPYTVGQIVPQEQSETMTAAYIGEKTTLDDVGMAMWSSKNIESVSGVDLGGTIETKLRVAGNRLVGTITNNTRFDISEARIRFTANRFDIANLPRGRTVDVNAAVSQPGQPITNQHKSYAGEVRARLDNLIETAVLSSSDPVLVGYARQRSPYGMAGGRVKVTNTTCCLFHLDIDMGNARILPLGAITGTVGTTQNARSAPRPAPGAGPSDATMVLSPGGYFLASFQMPSGGRMELVSFTVSGKSGYTNRGNGQPRVMYYLVTSSGSWEQIPAKIGPITNPAKHLRPGNRIVVKAQSVDSQDVTVSLGVSAVGRRK